MIGRRPKAKGRGPNLDAAVAFFLHQRYLLLSQYQNTIVLLGNQSVNGRRESDECRTVEVIVGVIGPKLSIPGITSPTEGTAAPHLSPGVNTLRSPLPTVTPLVSGRINFFDQRCWRAFGFFRVCFMHCKRSNRLLVSLLFSTTCWHLAKTQISDV